jgi:small subunit ribosomal protein S13
MKKLSLMEFNEITASKKNFIYMYNKVFGLGMANTYKLISKLGLSPFHASKKLSDLPRSFKQKMSSAIDDDDDLVVGDKLKKKIAQRLDLLNNIKNLRSFNFLNGLPVRGQRTKTNARTSKRRVGRVRRSKVSKTQK